MTTKKQLYSIRPKSRKDKKNEWDLMVYYTRLFLTLFIVLGAVFGIILILLIVGNYAY